MAAKSQLIVFGGLPGTGKTTLARALAGRLKAIYLRIDTIEQTLQRLDGMKIGSEGYEVAYSLAKENLRIGNLVICDSVNPVPVTRKAWRTVATQTGSDIVEIEIVCSDKQEYQRRVEARKADIPGHTMPTWQEVIDREYFPWETKNFVIDTAYLTMAEAFEDLIGSLAPWAPGTPPS